MYNPFILLTDIDEQKRLVNITRINDVIREQDEEYSTLRFVDDIEAEILETPEQVYEMINSLNRGML